MTERGPHLVHMSDFAFQSLDQQFEYVLAQSVFTHLPLNGIVRCLTGIDRALKPGGRFYATFFENPDGKANLGPITHPSLDGIPFRTYFDADPYHYDIATFQWACHGTGLRAQYLGDWDHPGNQKMMVFTKISREGT